MGWHQMMDEGSSAWVPALLTGDPGGVVAWPWPSGCKLWPEAINGCSLHPCSSLPLRFYLYYLFQSCAPGVGKVHLCQDGLSPAWALEPWEGRHGGKGGPCQGHRSILPTPGGQPCALRIYSLLTSALHCALAATGRWKGPNAQASIL